MRAADHIVELGPGRGDERRRVVREAAGGLVYAGAVRSAGADMTSGTVLMAYVWWTICRRPLAGASNIRGKHPLPSATAPQNRPAADLACVASPVLGNVLSGVAPPVLLLITGLRLRARWSTMCSYEPAATQRGRRSKTSRAGSGKSSGDDKVGEVVMVDQRRSRAPRAARRRSTWARGRRSASCLRPRPKRKAEGLTPSSFSFNSAAPADASAAGARHSRKSRCSSFPTLCDLPSMRRHTGSRRRRGRSSSTARRCTKCSI